MKTSTAILVTLCLVLGAGARCQARDETTTPIQIVVTKANSQGHGVSVRIRRLFSNVRDIKIMLDQDLSKAFQSVTVYLTEDKKPVLSVPARSTRDKTGRVEIEFKADPTAFKRIGVAVFAKTEKRMKTLIINLSTFAETD